MQCNHPMGFTVVKDGRATCFDCKAASPGRCVCGALYRTMVCQSRGHLNGPRLEAELVR